MTTIRPLLEQLGWSSDLIDEMESSASQIRDDLPEAQDYDLDDTESPDATSGTSIDILPMQVASQSLFFVGTSRRPA